MKYYKTIPLSTNLQRKLIFLISGITLGVGLLFSVACTSLCRAYLEGSLIHSTDTNLKFLTDSVEHNLESVFRLIQWTQTNTEISQYVDVIDDNKYAKVAVKAHERLAEEYQNSSANVFIQRIVIGNSHNRYIQIVPTIYSSNFNLAYEIPKLPYFYSLLDARNYDLSTGFLEDPFSSATYTSSIIPVIRPIYPKYNSKKTGWVFVELTKDIFCQPLQYYSCEEDAGLFLILGNHTYQMTDDGILAYDGSLHLAEDHEIKNANISSESKVYFHNNKETGKKDIIVVRRLNLSNCYIAQTLSHIELNNQLPILILIWIIIFGMTLLVVLSLSVTLHRLIAVRVALIRNQIDKVSSGNFAHEKNIEWNDELGDIGRGINTLAADIEKLLDTRIAFEKEKKDLEYKVLQNQINPHFLYNTLNSIKWMATIQGAQGIADMTTSLSRLLRSISKGTKQLIPIEEELSLVKDYFNIQNYRYGGTIQLEIVCLQDVLLQHSIIKFTLQPIVENAIFHGLEPKGGTGCIKITVQEQNQEAHNNNIEIIVYDNGVGISPDKIHSLLHSNEHAAPEFFKEIGVSNVHQRLQYEYGKDYGIHIESVVGEYTAMHIVIPKDNAAHDDASLSQEL